MSIMEDKEKEAKIGGQASNEGELEDAVELQSTTPGLTRGLKGRHMQMIAIGMSLPVAELN